MAEVGKNIKNIRKEKNLTQDDLAARLHCTRQTISNYETGKSEPDIALLIELAGVLEVEIGELIYGPKKGKKGEGSRRQKARAVAALVTAGMLLIAIRILMPYAQEYGRHYFMVTPAYLLQYVLCPFALALLGWGIAEAGWAFAGICIWEGRQRRTLRIIRICYYITVVILTVSAALALWTAADMTYAWWKIARMRRLRVDFDHSTIPRLIPGWLQMIHFRIFAQFRLGGAWLFLGAAFSLCKIESKEPDAGNTIEGQDQKTDHGGKNGDGK